MRSRVIVFQGSACRVRIFSIFECDHGVIRHSVSARLLFLMQAAARFRAARSPPEEQSRRARSPSHNTRSTRPHPVRHPSESRYYDYRCRNAGSLSDEERAAVSGPARGPREPPRRRSCRARVRTVCQAKGIAAGEKTAREVERGSPRAVRKLRCLLLPTRMAAARPLRKPQKTRRGCACPGRAGALPPGPEESAPAAATPPAPPVVVMAEPTETVSEAPPAQDEDTEGTDAAESQAAEKSRRELERELLEAKQHAQAARQKAFVEPVMQVAQTALEAADKHLADAAEMESSKPADAKAAYQLAAALYGEALQKAEALALASKAAANARAAALKVRAQVTYEIRTLAQKEIVAAIPRGERRDAGDAPDGQGPLRLRGTSTPKPARRRRARNRTGETRETEEILRGPDRPEGTKRNHG